MFGVSVFLSKVPDFNFVRTLVIGESILAQTSSGTSIIYKYITFVCTACINSNNSNIVAHGRGTGLLSFSVSLSELRAVSTGRWTWEPPPHPTPLSCICINDLNHTVSVDPMHHERCYSNNNTCVDFCYFNHCFCVVVFFLSLSVCQLNNRLHFFKFSVHLHGMAFPFFSDRNPLQTHSDVT